MKAKLDKLPEDFSVYVCIGGYPYAAVTRVLSEADFGDKVAVLILDPKHPAHHQD